MKGITLHTDPNGLDIVTIDRANLDPKYSPLVTGLLNVLQNDTDDGERQEFLYASGLLGGRAYSDDEPEYTDANLIERNPNYRPK